MAGRGSPREVGPILDPRIRAFRSGRWAPAADPLHDTRPGRDAIGLGMSFAAEVLRLRPGAGVGLVPRAVGGTPLSRWEKGGDLYAAAVDAARAALAAAPGSSLAGALWHQGENDSRREEDASSYASRLDRMVADLRADLASPGLPFVAGDLGRFLDGRPEYPCAGRVNAALRGLPARAAACAFVPSGGLADKGDLLHFNARALRAFGGRYAAAWAALR
jgi:hypothetical protein